MTGSPWHGHIQQNHIDFARIPTQKFDRGRTLCSLEYLEARFTEHLHISLAQLVLVFHNQNGVMLRRSVKGEATPASAHAADSKTKMKGRLKGVFDYCDGVYSGFVDARLNDPADFFGF